MKKLYYVKREYSVETVFAAEASSDAELKRKAILFLESEGPNKDNELNIKEIKNIIDVPSSWDLRCLIWGVDDDKTVEDFLKDSDPEYQEYLRLKEKFKQSTTPP